MTKLEIGRLLRPGTLAMGLSAVLTLGAAGPAAAAQASGQTSAGPIEEIVVTGSRIRHAAADTFVPTTVIGQQVFAERGHLSAADALNDVTTVNPALNQAPGNGDPSGNGQQFPELFGLGTGRTLTLVNGRRFVTTSNGLGDAQVDANIIPTGLIERIEIVQAGAAAVYGSDAIAGVVNYILRDDFQGVEVDAQYGDSSRNDYSQEKLRLTAGTNFAESRGNVAVNVEWSSTPDLLFEDRPRTNLSRVTQSNPANTGPNDGIPAVREVLDAHFWNFNGNGIVYNFPAPVPPALTMVGGAPVQFAQGGALTPYDPGQILGIPFAEGGDGFRFSNLTNLRSAVERTTGNVIAHYDVTDRITLNAEFLFARTEGEDVPQGYSRTVLSPAPLDAIPFFASNPFLSEDAVTQLASANPGFASGAPLFLSRIFQDDAVPSDVRHSDTDTYRLLLGAEGDFDAGTRNFYWEVSGSYARVDGEQRVYDVHNANFTNAVFAFPDGSGGAACLVNIDGDPTNDDPDCVPLNPFGPDSISPEARRYVSVMTGNDYENEQFNFLATIGTSLFTLPAGQVDAVLAYERRDEEAEFEPLAANALTGVGAESVAQSGDYDTNELSVELLVPVIGEAMEVPLAQALELNGTYRYVDHSIAGKEDVWSVGLRWTPVDDLVLRASRSRNFRAPTLTQLVAPTNVTRQALSEDPCDADRINGGPDPAVRLANCQAEWAANPQYPDLDTFQDPAENFTIAEVSSGGNAELANEVSDTTTYGFVLQPRFIPGLTFSVDRIEIELEDGLSAFTPADFFATCYDNTPQPTDICNTFQRLSMDQGTNPAGTIVSARATTFNAGVIEYEGEYYHLNYDLPMADWFPDTNAGDLSLSIEATHSDLLRTSVTGTTFVRSDNTVEQPDWVGRFNAHYSRGPMLLTYQANYLSEVIAEPDATIETTPVPVIERNITHSVSAHYDFNRFSFRVGVDNLTDKAPSYPTFSHGDILGRRYFVGFSANWE